MIKLTYMSGDIRDKVELVLLDLKSEFSFDYYPDSDEVDLELNNTDINLLLYLAEDFKILVSRNRWFFMGEYVQADIH